MGILRKFVERADRAAGEGIEKVVSKELPPRGEKKPPVKPKPVKGAFAQSTGERLGASGLLAFTIGSAAVGALLLAGCRPVAASPTSRPTYTEEADQPSATTASCEEPADWCHRGDAAEVVQR